MSLNKLLFGRGGPPLVPIRPPTFFLGDESRRSTRARQKVVSNGMGWANLTISPLNQGWADSHGDALPPAVQQALNGRRSSSGSRWIVQRRQARAAIPTVLPDRSDRNWTGTAITIT